MKGATSFIIFLVPFVLNLFFFVFFSFQKSFFWGLASWSMGVFCHVLEVYVPAAAKKLERKGLQCTRLSWKHSE